MNDDQLLEVATDEKATYRQRYLASAALRGRIYDDRHLIDYYWWALHPFHDDAGEGLCFVHECIVRAEYYNAHKK